MQEGPRVSAKSQCTGPLSAVSAELARLDRFFLGAVLGVAVLVLNAGTAPAAPAGPGANRAPTPSSVRPGKPQSSTSTADALPAALEGLRGPADQSAIEIPAPTRTEDFDRGGDSRVALLICGPDAGTWLGLAEGLRALGVPLTVTRDWRRAVTHRMVILYPLVSGRTLPPDGLSALRQFPARGGTLVAFQVVGGALAATFGLNDTVSGRTRLALDFDRPGAPERETHIPLGNADQPDSVLGSHAYRPVDAQVLARYDTGEAAILRKDWGPGRAYAVGLDFGDYVLRGMNNRQQGLARSSANQYEPAADMLLHWLKDRYREAEPLGVTLGTTPEGRALPVIITHDIDYLRSMLNAPAYLAFEREAGILATYFVQTKYVRDWADQPFMTDEGLKVIRALKAAGMEIASHSVSHSRVFASFAQGSGGERFPDYRPIVDSHFSCVGGCTIFGELRISRYLLGEAAGSPPVSFRAGHLANPVSLPESLVATGYLFESNTTANDMISHLPVHAHFRRETTSELPLFEFPITIEDEAVPPLGQRVAAALAVAEDVIRDEGIFVILIHPNVTDHKLQFERDFVTAIRARAWFGTLEQYGRWWTARDAVEVDTQAAEDGGLSLHLRAPLPIEGLTLQLPAGWQPAVGGIVRSVTGGQAVLGPLSGDVELRLDAAGS